MYSFAGINGKTFKMHSLGPQTGEGSYEDFFRLKQLSPSSRLILSVGGWGEGGQKYSDMAASQANRRSFIASVIETMEQHKEFDGFDLDWEYPGATDRQGRFADKDNFLKLVQELRSAFDEYAAGLKSRNSTLSALSARRSARQLNNNRQLELSMAVPIAKFRLQEGYEVYELCQLMDFINLMTYDLRGNWAGVSTASRELCLPSASLIMIISLNQTNPPNYLPLVCGRPHAALPATWHRRVGLRETQRGKLVL